MYSVDLVAHGAEVDSLRKEIKVLLPTFFRIWSQLSRFASNLQAFHPSSGGL